MKGLVLKAVLMHPETTLASSAGGGDWPVVEGKVGENGEDQQFQKYDQSIANACSCLGSGSSQFQGQEDAWAEGQSCSSAF